MTDPTATPASTDHQRSSRRRWAASAGVLVLAVAAAVTLTAFASASGSSGSSAAAADPPCPSGSARLTVQGSGIANGTPNLLTLTLNVSVTGGTAQQALANNNTTTSSVTGALTAGGVRKQDLQTTGFSIQPDYTFHNGTQVLTGYSVNNSVVAKLRDFATAGSVIDAASAAGGNAVQINSLSFSIEDPRKLQDEARQNAVQQAVSHAGAMAQAADERLGPVCSLTDQSSVSPPPSYDLGGYAAGTTAAPPSPSVPLEAGSQQANAQVTLVYSLRAPRPARS